MKKLLLSLAFLGPTTLLAQSGFDGVWRINLDNTQLLAKDNYSLQDGVFKCSTCDPKVDAKADGQDHPLGGSPYFDAASVRVVDDRTVEIVNKKSGKVSNSVKLFASQDGKTLTTEFSNVTETGENVKGKYTSTRVDAAPGSAHKISGVWQPGKLESLSDNAMEVTYKATGDGLSFSDKAGNSYTARFDGKDYPYKGDPGIRPLPFGRSTPEQSKKRTSAMGRWSGSVG